MIYDTDAATGARTQTRKQNAHTWPPTIPVSVPYCTVFGIYFSPFQIATRPPLPHPQITMGYNNNFGAEK